MKKKILMLITAIATLFMNLGVTYAASAYAGSTAVFSGTCSSSSIGVGDTITLTFSLKPSELSTGFQGFLDYDSTYLQLVSKSFANKTSMSVGSLTESSGKFLFADTTGGGAALTANAANTVFTVQFKTLAQGTTHVKTKTEKVSVVSSSYYAATVTSADVPITIGAATSSTTASTTKSTTTSSTSKSTASTAATTASTASTAATKSGDTSLNLSGSGVTISKTSDGNFTVSVLETLTSLNLTGTMHSKATASGSITGTGTATGTIGLSGTNATETFNIKVKAENGTEKTYTLTVTKYAAPATLDGDSSLKDLTVDGKTITGFSSTKTNYTLNVDKDTTSINLAGLANSSKASVSVSGGTNLKEGNNVATVTVTAEDGSKTVYTINIVKPTTTTTTKKGATTTAKKSSETGIKSITIGSSHTMEPSKFSDDVDVYDITVPSDVESLDLSIILKDSNAKYTITGNENFQFGKVNVVTIKITAEDGTVRTVILNVTRTTDVDGTKLTELDPGTGTLSPEFDPDTLTYTVTVDGDTDSLPIKYNAPDGSTVKVYGNSDLKEGWNTVLVGVTDENGYTRTYTLNVYKEAKKILGLTHQQFAIVAGIIGGLLLTFLLILLLLARRKKKDEQIPAEQAPVIDFKPEFNFGSRNGTDDDVVYPNAVLNQDSKVQKDVQVDNADEDVISALNPTIEHRNTNTNENYGGAYLPNHEEKSKEIPYDPYDEVVTKDELIDAIEEGLETKNPEKLKMLLEQEELNRKKDEIRRREGK